MNSNAGDTRIIMDIKYERALTIFDRALSNNCNDNNTKVYFTGKSWWISYGYYFNIMTVRCITKLNR